MIRFEKRNVADIPPKWSTVVERHNDGSVTRIVEKFVNGKDVCIECFYDNNEYSNANNFRKAFENVCKYLEISNVEVLIRGNRVFLVKGGENE